MASCGFNNQKTANSIQPDINWMLQRFETNVDALDALLSNYNAKLNECNHRNGFQCNRNHVITENRPEIQGDRSTAENKIRPKPFPKPLSSRVNEVKVYDNSNIKVFPLNLRTKNDLSMSGNYPASTETQITGYRELLQRSYTRLVNYISSADDISARLFQGDHLTQSELETVQEARSTAKANERLLNVLLLKPVETYRAFLDELQRTRQGHVLSMLLGQDDSAAEFQYHAKLIRQHYVFLTEMVEVIDSGLLSHLVADDVLTDRERTAIATEWNRYRQVEVLLGVIARKSALGFESFLRALCETNQKHISDTLKGVTGNSIQLKTERISPKSSEIMTSGRINRSTNMKFRQLNSGLPFLLRVEISAKILSLQNNNRTTEAATAEHSNTVLQGFVEMRKSCFALETERNEFSDRNASVSTAKRVCEDRLRKLQREFSVLESKFGVKMSELLKLKLQQSDSELDKERIQIQLVKYQALNEGLTAKLQEAVVEIHRKRKAMMEMEDFKRLKEDHEQLKSQLKSTKADLEELRNVTLAASESAKTAESNRVLQIEKETEITIEKLRLETQSQLLEISRQSKIDEITRASLHNEIVRLNKCISELEQENCRLENELKIELEKFQRTQSARLRTTDESDIAGYHAKHLDRLDIPGAWVEGAVSVDDRLYLICRGSNVLVVYSNQRPHNRQYSIPITGMMGPIDIVACSLHKCLYIADSGSRCVWRVLIKSEYRCNRWLTDVTWPYTLSVANDGRVLVTKRPSNLDIYDSDSRLVTSVQLPPSIIDPWHAVAATLPGTYLVVHGDKISQRHGVTEISETGDIVRSCVDLPGKDLGCFDRPRYLAFDAEGNILVADYGNNRVVMLNPCLNLVRVLLKKDGDGMKNTVRVYCSDGKSLLVINNGILDKYTLTKSLGGSSNTL